MCKALKIKKKPGHLYVLIGDGECNEGSIWESALIASHLKLDNITLIIDNNLSSKRALDMGNLESKFTSFGWVVVEIEGHDHREIDAALRKRVTGKPIAIVANTIKGFGVSTLESKPEWHHRSPNAEELAFLLEETN
jgi:transketolase